MLVTGSPYPVPDSGVLCIIGGFAPFRCLTNRAGPAVEMINFSWTPDLTLHLHSESPKSLETKNLALDLGLMRGLQPPI